MTEISLTCRGGRAVPVSGDAACESGRALGASRARGCERMRGHLGGHHVVVCDGGLRVLGKQLGGTIQPTPLALVHDAAFALADFHGELHLTSWDLPCLCAGSHMERYV